MVAFVMLWWLLLCSGGCCYVLVAVVMLWWLLLCSGGCCYVMVAVVPQFTGEKQPAEHNPLFTLSSFTQ
jgi:hypothetical protein